MHKYYYTYHSLYSCRTDFCIIIQKLKPSRISSFGYLPALRTSLWEKKSPSLTFCDYKISLFISHWNEKYHKKLNQFVKKYQQLLRQLKYQQTRIEQLTQIISEQNFSSKITTSDFTVVEAELQDDLVTDDKATKIFSDMKLEFLWDFHCIKFFLKWAKYLIVDGGKGSTTCIYF